MYTFVTRASFRLLLSGTATCLALAGTGGAYAQSSGPTATPQNAASPQPDTSGPDIVVTAQRREESLQKVPLAISAVTGASLTDRNITNISQLSQQIPNLTIGEQAGNAQLTLRGIGTQSIALGTEGSIAFNVDNVYYARPGAALASFYDLAQIEVLRGPQGTLYGRNATGGLVNLVTARPTSYFQGYVNLTEGNYNTTDVDGAISGPIAGDRVTARLAFQTVSHDGYGKNILTGNGIDNRNSKAIRGEVDFWLTDDLTLRLMGDYYHSDDNSNTYHYFGPAATFVTPAFILAGGPQPSNIRDIAFAVDPRSRMTYDGASADLTYQHEGLTLKSLTSIRHSEYLNTNSDIDGGSGSNTLSGGYFQVNPLQTSEDSNQFSEELQVSINSDRNKFVTGLYYFYEKDSGYESVPFQFNVYAGVPFSVSPTPNLYFQGFFAGGSQKTNAGAIYAQDTYSLTEKLRFTVGGRYSIERKSVFDQSQFAFILPFVFDEPLTTTPQIAETTFRSFTPKVGFDYSVNPDVLVYVSYSKGFKSGTYNVGGLAPPVKPETVNAYEAGLKATLLSGRIKANIALFDYNYSDLQVSIVQGNLLALSNAAAAHVYGVEGEFTVRPFDAPFLLTLAPTWLHARYANYVDYDQNAAPTPVLTNLNGHKLDNAPDYTVNLGAEYRWNVGSGKITLRGESYWSGKLFFTPFNATALSQRAYNLINAYLNYDVNSKFSIRVYGKNLTNNTIKTAATSGSIAIGAPIIGFLQAPRTYGVTLGYHF